MFSCLLAQRLLEFRKELDNEQWRFLLTGGISLDKKLPDPPKEDWIAKNPKAWGEICRLSELKGLHIYNKSKTYLIITI